MLSPGLAGAQPRPAEIIASLRRHPAIVPFVAGGTLEEPSVHLIPEGGYATISTLAGDVILVAGDAATSTLAVGIYLEGVNFAIGSGPSRARWPPRRWQPATRRRRAWAGTAAGSSRASC